MKKMNLSYWLNAILAVAVLVMLYILLFGGASQCTKEDAGKTTQIEQKESIVLDNIFQRKSVRKFVEGKAVSKEDLTILVKAGMAAPTARNSQPWEFVVITDKNILNTMAEKLPYAKMLAGAPSAIVVCGNTERMLEGEGRDNWVLDCSAATENILLAVEAKGLGAVWTGVYPSKDRMKEVALALSLPENIVPFCVIPLGYPTGVEQPKDKYVPERISFKL